MSTTRFKNNKDTHANTREALAEEFPGTPVMAVKRKRLVTVRFTDAEYDTLAANARTAGVSLSDLLREAARSSQPIQNLLGNGRVGLFWGRITAMLAVVAERSRSMEDKAAALLVIAQLVSVESELRDRRQEAMKA